MSIELTSGLTAHQAAAVEHAEGPLLVLAGPGSGKTRVITRRIARLIQRGVHPREILAITFTNKAAREMAERLDVLLDGATVWVSTFHRFCARVLRSRAEAVGLSPNFTIFDTGDQQNVIKSVLSDLDIDAIHYSPRAIAGHISRAKNDLQTAEQFERAFQESIGNHMQAVTARVYPAYQNALLRANAVDFDDLLLHVVTLLAENPELREELDERYRYVLVDEYQDTNAAQYQIVAALSQRNPNLCVTGDPDQSIYGWRGARIDNILRFEADFPRAQVIRLEQNFRSTRLILRAADRLIAFNRQRKVKSLLTENSEGEPVELLCFRDGRHEADWIAREMRRQVEEEQRNWSDFAICYRVNALSRELERALVRHRIPFQVAAGAQFFERAEVKDMLAYLRLIYNPLDRAAFDRVAALTRHVGKTTLSRLVEYAREFRLNFHEAAGLAPEIPRISKPASKALVQLAEMLAEFSEASFGPVEPLLRLIDERIGYTRRLREGDAEPDEQRVANVEELITAAAQFDREMGEGSSLEAFLESTSLVNDVDRINADAGRVTLMTLHAAKGLEFPVVYIVGVEHGLIPHERAIRENELRQIEEERRLLFVGMTRAQERLYLTQTIVREFRGSRQSSIPSQFLGETEFRLRECDEEFGLAFNSDGGVIDAEAATIPSLVTRDSSTDELSRRPLLTTGADLLNGTGAAIEIPQGFAVGMTVRHPQYGRGTVVAVSGLAKRRTVVVEFEEDGRRSSFIASKCPLQPVGVS